MISSLSGFLCHLAGTGPGEGQASLCRSKGKAQCVQHALMDQQRLRRQRGQEKANQEHTRKWNA